MAKRYRAGRAEQRGAGAEQYGAGQARGAAANIAGAADDAAGKSGAASRAETLADRRAGWVIFIGCFVAAGLILTLTPGALNLAALSAFSLKAPDFAPLLALSPLVQFHVYTVALALVLGPVQFVLPKGTRTHRLVGWAWVAAMGSTAIATLFIRDMRDGQFSPIHLFSLMTFVGLPLAIWLARAGKAAAHARTMIGLYIGLVIAGVSAIAPGRVVWEIFAR